MQDAATELKRMEAANLDKDQTHSIKNSSSSTGGSSSSSDIMAYSDDTQAMPVKEDDPVKKTVMTIIRLICLFAALYMFIVSLDLMSAAFRLVGGKSAGQILANSEIFQNAIAGLMVGVLATVLLQSSSTTTSIIVTMTGAGILSVRQSAYLVMGSNIGTSVTNTLVAMSQIADPKQFELSFSGATVHDVFNWLTVICILPLEASTGVLEIIVKAITGDDDTEGNEALKFDIIKVVTKPLTELLVQLDSSIVNDPEKLKDAVTILKTCCNSISACKDDSIQIPDCGNETAKICTQNCSNLATVMHFANMSDAAIGAIYVVISLTSLSLCLILLVRTLQSLLGDAIKKQIRRLTTSDRFGTLIGYVSILVGAVMTFLVQSSSVFTSAITPLVGAGVIDLIVMYPLTLGSNIGTTITSLLAALASGTKEALQTSLIHLFFNIAGILIWYPIPFMRAIPIKVARLLGRTTGKYRWFAALYLIMCFLLMPLSFFGLSLIHWAASLAFAALLLTIIGFVSIVNLLQEKKPNLLPAVLRNWLWLPLGLRSLEPYDNILRKAYLIICCKKPIVAPQNSDHVVDNNDAQSPPVPNNDIVHKHNEVNDDDQQQVNRTRL